MSRRTQIVIPTPIDVAVKRYQAEQGIASWTQAMFELVRKGLSSLSKEGGEK